MPSKRRKTKKSTEKKPLRKILHSQNTSSSKQIFQMMNRKGVLNTEMKVMINLMTRKKLRSALLLMIMLTSIVEIEV